MGRPPRYVPPNYNKLVEVTTRTLQGRFLLRPSDEMNEIIIGILGRALEQCPGVGIVAFTFVSNHYEMILLVKDAETLAGFMEYLNGNLGKEVSRLYRWKEKIWGRRYTCIPLVDEESEVTRLRYVLAHGAKEGLVKRPVDWPGVKSLDTLLYGETLSGYWFDRTEEYKARRRGLKVGKYDFATRYEVPLVPLPCWRALNEEQRRQQVAALVDDIEQEAIAVNRSKGRIPPGPEYIKKQHPHDSPENLKRSPIPLCHAASKHARKAYYEIYTAVVKAFRAAADCLKAGNSDPGFPQGCFPPGLPFVPFQPELAAAPP